MRTDKLGINWQNFARVRLQLKFAFMALFVTPASLVFFPHLTVFNHLTPGAQPGFC